MVAISACSSAQAAVITSRRPRHSCPSAATTPLCKPLRSTRNFSRFRTAAVTKAPTTAKSAPDVAVLPGTPKDFDVPEEVMVGWAQRLFASNNGIDDESLLAPNFRFEFPVVSLAREEYLSAVRGFNLKSALPDLTPRAYHYRVDPYEPNRVWFTTRSTGTHLGSLTFGPSEYEATGKEYLSAPECLSYTFDKDGKCTSFTGGYIMDRRIGNTGGLGALFGVLYSIGVKVPTPGTLGWKVATAVNKANTLLKGVRDKVLGKQ